MVNNLGLFVFALLAVALPAQANTNFFDDFERADGIVGNGWTQISGAEYPTQILNGIATEVPDSTFDRKGGLTRPFAMGNSVTISGTLYDGSSSWGGSTMFRSSCWSLVLRIVSFKSQCRD